MILERLFAALYHGRELFFKSFFKIIRPIGKNVGTIASFLKEIYQQERPLSISPVLFFGDYSQELAFKNYEKVEKSDFFQNFSTFFRKNGKFCGSRSLYI